MLSWTLNTIHCDHLIIYIVLFFKKAYKKTITRQAIKYYNYQVKVMQKIYINGLSFKTLEDNFICLEIVSNPFNLFNKFNSKIFNRTSNILCELGYIYGYLHITLRSSTGSQHTERRSRWCSSTCCEALTCLNRKSILHIGDSSSAAFS